MKRKIKKNTIIMVISIVLLVIVSFGVYKWTEYRNSTPYLLKELGYTEKESAIIQERLEKQQIQKVLLMDYDPVIVSLLEERYFLFDNLSNYLKYKKGNTEEEIKNVVSIVNVGADKEHYEKTSMTNMSKEYLILVNKYRSLAADYAPDDLVDIPSQYAYANNQTRSEVYEHYRDMWNAAKKEDLTLIVTSSYRTYEKQNQLYNTYTSQQGRDWADSVSARAGFSEHQTGLALDIVTYNSTMDNFEQSDEFAWLSKNAHKYGFLLRYPKGKEYITGYSYESWHYRYVGIEVATEVYDKDITFDEYYAYYLGK